MPIAASTLTGFRSSFFGNAVLAIVFAAFCLSFFTGLNVVWDPAFYGEIGLQVDDTAPQANDTSWPVTSVVAGSPADLAGIRIGDNIDRVHATTRDRLVLLGSLPAREHDSITVNVERAGDRRTLILHARPLPALPVTDRILLVVQYAVGLVYVLVGLALVLFRPNWMTWGFCLFSFAIVAQVTRLPAYQVYAPMSWYLTADFASNVMLAAGIVGFLVFCLRFPSNASTGWGGTAERVAPYLFIALTALISGYEIASYVTVAPETFILTLWHAWNLAWLGTIFLGTAVLLTTYARARGLERYRLTWVIYGLSVTFAGLIATAILFEGLLSANTWVFCALSLLYVGLPLCVAYAVIRHRVIDVRIVISRSLAAGAVGSFIALMFLAVDWVFSIRLPSSRLQTAAYVGVALLTGFFLNAARQRIGHAIDALFFRQWQRTRQQAEAIVDALQRAASKHDLYEPLTRGIAGAFSLSSVALFESAHDGGLLRVAAYGWPPGAMWHVLPGDALAERAKQCSRAADIDDLQWDERDVPRVAARPSIVFPIASDKRLEAILLCGAHENGTGLDSQEVRAVSRMCATAAVIYGESPSEPVHSAPRSEVLSV